MAFRNHASHLLGAVALAAVSLTSAAQYTTPHVATTAGDDTVTLGASVFVNHGLVGVGRIPAGTIDPFGESFGSVSSLQITGWSSTGPGTYAGTFNILPDRGYNSGAFYADYAARIQQVPFVFTPYTGTANIGGSTVAAQIAAQNQVSFPASTCGVGPCVSGVRFTYVDPTSGRASFTTGLDPDVGRATIFGKTLPYVRTYTGLQSPSSPSLTTYTIDKLPIDAEALALKADGSGYVGDEYGAYIYYFDAAKQFVGAIVPPAALVPRSATTTPDYGANSTIVNGRRVNQGIEGIAADARRHASVRAAAERDDPGLGRQRAEPSPDATARVRRRHRRDAGRTGRRIRAHAADLPHDGQRRGGERHRGAERDRRARQPSFPGPGARRQRAREHRPEPVGREGDPARRPAGRRADQRRRNGERRRPRPHHVGARDACGRRDGPEPRRSDQHAQQRAARQVQRRTRQRHGAGQPAHARREVGRHGPSSPRTIRPRPATSSSSSPTTTTSSRRPAR